ncbi:Ig-like domain-containing protein [Arenibacter troitsensis]|uniref:Pectate lyase superfamily protein n=1 Tax=Arenibacter troitsensis TaxID=188872 RepID=A0A1X7IXV0_9FLAO|nr:Ig-like domain-containing protein [Arenibacter troitsensis]SMG20134.1 hypothetical protein SAMN03080602_01284 [Arenibacter troitsensis]
MKFRPSNFIQLPLITIVLILSFSCNKDSDLLAEYVIEQPQAFLVNDVVVTLANNPIVIEPLNNDTFKEPEKVTITEVTPPKMGTAEVQEDNSVVYTPNPDETGTDEFDYTTTVTNPDNSVSTETGSITVTVTPTDKTPTDPNAVNFSKYGAVGDGKTDDTKALQAALNAEGSLVANAGAIFKINSTLNITQGFEHTIDWSGATIITDVANLTMININKKTSNGGTTTMQDLLLDANNKGTIGLAVYSRTVLTNVDGKDYGQTATANISPTHIMARFEGNDSDAHGDWIFDGCDADGLTGYGTECDYLDGVGAANAYLVYWMTVPTIATTITFKNATVKNGYGPDGQNVGVFSPGQNVSNTPALTVFDNITSSGFERRSWKLFCGNLIIRNCTINNDLDSNGLTQCVSAGMVAVGSGSGSKGASNIIFENTNFVGRPSGGRDNRVIPVDTHDMHFNNCTWSNGANLSLTLGIDNINVTSSRFEAGSTINEYNLRAPYGTINLAKDNVYIGFTPSLKNTFIKYVN